MILDEFFVFSRGIDFFQLLDARILSVGLGGYEDVNKRVVSTFNQQGILGGIQLSNEGIVGVDNGNIKITHCFRNRSSVKLLDLVVFG